LTVLFYALFYKSKKVKSKAKMFVKEKNYKYKLRSLLLGSKNSPGKKFILSKNIAILLRKKFKRTFFALNPES